MAEDNPLPDNPQLTRLQKEIDELENDAELRQRWPDLAEIAKLDTETGPYSDEELDYEAPLASAAQNEPEPPPVLWHVPDEESRRVDPVLSEGEVALLGSAGGLGKSTLTLALALAAAEADAPDVKAGEACGLRVRTGPVLLVSYEDSPRRIAHRLKKLTSIFEPRRFDQAGVKLTNGLSQLSEIPTGIRLLRDPEPLFSAADPRGDRTVGVPGESWNRLRRAADALEPSLIVIDPASAALEGFGAAESAPVRAFLRELSDLATECGAGILVVGHDTKAARNDASAGLDPGAGVIAGSATWYDAARGVLYLRRGGTDRDLRILQCRKSNHGRALWGVELCERLDGYGNFAGYVLNNKLDETGVLELVKPPPGSTNSKSRSKKAASQEAAPMSPWIPDDDPF